MNLFSKVLLVSILSFWFTTPSATSAYGNKRPRTEEPRKISTPGHTHKVGVFHPSPESASLSSAVYLIHDGKDEFKLEKVDLDSTSVSRDDFLEKLKPLREKVQALHASGELHKIHRYIGLVSSGKFGTRTAEDRFGEHLQSCNSEDKDSNKRLCLGLRASAKAGRDVHATVLIHGIHPSQVNGVESYLIRLFRCLEDLGWNSVRGSDLELFESDPDHESLDTAPRQLFPENDR